MDHDNLGRKSKRDDALEHLLKARNKILDGKPDLVSLLRTCVTASSLLGRSSDDQWLNYELDGYPDDKDVPTYRDVAGRFYDDDDYQIDAPERLLRYELRIPIFRVMHFSQSQTALSLVPTSSQIDKVERASDVTPARFKIIAATFGYVQNALTNALLNHVNNLILELEYGDIPSSIFEEIRQRVDKQLIDLSKDAIEKLELAYEKLTSGGSDQNWSLVALECRGILRDVADAVFPPQDKPHKALDGQTYQVGPNEPINRLLAFVDKNSTDDVRRFAIAETQYLGSLLDQLSVSINKAVHHKVERQDAKRCVIYTYLLLGDILLLRK